MEDPQALARAHIESADITLYVVLARRRAAGHVRGADDDDVLRDDRRRMQPDLARDQIDLLIVVLLQIDDAVLAEAGHGRAGLGVKRDQPVAGRDIEDSLFSAVGPIRESTARELPGRAVAARAFVLAVHPQQLARRRIQRHHGPPRPGRRDRAAIDHQRRTFELEFGPRTKRVGLEPPRDFELVEVSALI